MPEQQIPAMIAAHRNRPKESVEHRAYKILLPVLFTRPTEPRPFSAAETFFNKLSGVKMVEHGSNFKNWAAGYTEEDLTDEMLILHDLIQDANDSEIIAELGGEEKAEVKLSQVWQLLKRQPNGEKEVAPLADGRANICFVRLNGVLRKVDLTWFGVGWHAGAYALDDDRWGAGRRVLSRNS